MLAGAFGLAASVGVLLVASAGLASTGALAVKAACTVVTKTDAAAVLKVPAAKLQQQVGPHNCSYSESGSFTSHQPPSLGVAYSAVTPGTCKLLLTHRYQGAPQAHIGTCSFWDRPGIEGNPRNLSVYDEVKRVYMRFDPEGITPGPATEARMVALARRVLSRS
jgi:hypothetical protein